MDEFEDITSGIDIEPVCERCKLDKARTILMNDCPAHGIEQTAYCQRCTLSFMAPIVFGLFHDKARELRETQLGKELGGQAISFVMGALAHAVEEGMGDALFAEIDGDDRELIAQVRRDMFMVGIMEDRDQDNGGTDAGFYL